MSERPFKRKEYFEKLLTIPEQEIDYTESPSTKTADWEGAEVLFPITPEEFRAFREFIRDRRDKVEMLIAKPDGEKIKKIAILGEQFPDIHLFENSASEEDPLVDIGHNSKYTKRRSELQTDWHNALQFFLSKVFYGRLGDNRMLEYLWHAYKILDRNRLRLLNPNFSLDYLDLQMEREGVKNRHDRRMVIDSVEMARNLDVWDNNIALYTLDRVRNGKITEVYKALVHKGDRGLHGIGPKRASVFIRDVVMIWKLEKHLNTDEDFITCVPIDTHVRRTCERAGIRVDSVITPSNDEESDLLLNKAIIDACKSLGVSPLLFDAGAWMLGMARDRVKINREIMGGKPVIRGRRIPVEQILRKLDAGILPDDIISDHPKLTLDDIRAAQVFAAGYLANEEL